MYIRSQNVHGTVFFMKIDIFISLVCIIKEIIKIEWKSTMVFGMLIEILTGAICVVFGLLIWKKQKVSLLHDYHYRNVKTEDIPAYAQQMGIGLIIMGTGIIITGLLDFVSSSFWWVSLIAGFSIGSIVLYRTQKKYNGSIMN